jgi:hypothetical protein
MNPLIHHENFVFAKHDGLALCLRYGTAPEDIAALLKEPGEILKSSPKSVTRRVGPWVVKESRATWANCFKHTFQKARHRRGWFAAQHLDAQGVGAPRTIAFVERRMFGLVLGNALISEYLNEARSVEQFLLALIQRGAGQQTLAEYLAALADAVNKLTASGAYHADLSGKNIYTRDGHRFYFIDLDDVTLGGPYDDARRLKNHAQLYDSFCDVLGDSLLFPFIQQMLPPETNPRVWMPKVRKAQEKRRIEHAERNPGAPRPLLPE